MGPANAQIISDFGSRGSRGTQSFQVLVLVVLASTPVIYPFDTGGTREYSVLVRLASTQVILFSVLVVFASTT